MFDWIKQKLEDRKKRKAEEKQSRVIGNSCADDSVDDGIAAVFLLDVVDTVVQSGVVESACECVSDVVSSVCDCVSGD